MDFLKAGCEYEEMKNIFESMLQKYNLILPFLPEHIEVIFYGFRSRGTAGSSWDRKTLATCTPQEISLMFNLYKDKSDASKFLAHLFLYRMSTDNLPEDYEDRMLSGPILKRVDTLRMSRGSLLLRKGIIPFLYLPKMNFEPILEAEKYISLIVKDKYML